MARHWFAKLPERFVNGDRLIRKKNALACIAKWPRLAAGPAKEPLPLDSS
jgi:hypothetical protein